MPPLPSCATHAQVLLMGKSGSGKTSMRSIIFADYLVSARSAVPGEGARCAARGCFSGFCVEHGAYVAQCERARARERETRNPQPVPLTLTPTQPRPLQLNKPAPSTNTSPTPHGLMILGEGHYPTFSHHRCGILQCAIPRYESPRVFHAPCVRACARARVRVVLCAVHACARACACVLCAVRACARARAHAGTAGAHAYV